MRAKLFPIAALVLSAMSVAHASAKPVASASAKQALLDQESQRFAAQVAADGATLDRAIADDALYIHANGVAQTKAEYLHDVATGASRYRAIEASDRTAAIYGQTAVTHGLYVLSVGTDRKILARYTGVYIKRGAKWLVLSWQSTPSVTAPHPN